MRPVGLAVALGLLACSSGDRPPLTAVPAATSSLPAPGPLEVSIGATLPDREAGAATLAAYEKTRREDARWAEPRPGLLGPDPAG